MEKSVFLRLRNVSKIYPNGVQAVYDYNLDVAPKEFIVFVGPSGCGKSTTLRMIAGLEDVTAGDVYIDQRLANNLSPKERDIAMVFQSYALYPHMNVYHNLAFGLRMLKIQEAVLDQKGQTVTALDLNRIAKIKKSLLTIEQDLIKINKVQVNAARIIDLEKQTSVIEQLNAMELSLEEEKTKKQNELAFYLETPVPTYRYRPYTKQEIDEKARRAAQVLDIENYLFSRPRELSGGQRQRVALGRSIVRNAKLFLMDEPLSNLDAKLRLSMRSEIVSLHRALHATTVYVTHDQIEAMTMADRIVVMKDGYIQQIGTPLDIYHHPVNIFVATFMGSPAMNIIPSTYEKGRVMLNNQFLTLSTNKQISHDAFIQKQIETLLDRNQLLLKYIDSFKLELENVKNTFKMKRVNKKMNLRELELADNIKKIDQYQLFISAQNHSISLGLRPEDITLSLTTTSNQLQATIELSKEQKLYAGGIFIGGTHPASSGGAYNNIVFGFLGASMVNGKLEFKPNLQGKMKQISLQYWVNNVLFTRSFTND